MAGKKQKRRRKKNEPKPFDCTTCGGKCCRYFALEIDEPGNFDDFDSIRWYLFHEQTYVFVEDGKWYLCITTPCRNLDEQSRCTIYETRPLICRKHDPAECEFEDEDEWNFDKCFRTPEELEKHMRKKLGKKCFERGYRKYEKKKAKKNLKDSKKK